MQKLCLLLALGLSMTAAEGATRVKGHWDSRGRWIPARWVDDADSTVTPRRRRIRAADRTFRLDVDAIWRRPYRGAEEVSPPPGMGWTWRQALRPAGPDPRRPGAGVAPNGGFGFVVAALNRVRYSRGADKLAVDDQRMDTGVVWTETSTHRVKTRYEDGRVVGVWKFSKKA